MSGPNANQVAASSVVAQFTSDQLLFVAWSFSDWKTSSDKATDYHLAELSNETIRTSCGMVIVSSSQQPSYIDVTEPQQLKICSVCSSRAADFSKKHFGGRKLQFKRSAVKLAKGKTHESNEEMYHQENTERKPGELF